MSQLPPLGRVVATELKPSTPHQFHFWTARESPIGIGAIVRVEENGRVVFGVVTDAFAYSDLVNAGHALDQARGALEVVVGDRYRAGSDGWLVLDGSLAVSPRWAGDPRMVAISKSHSILPFDGADLEQYLRLPCAHRSSVYAPATRSLAPVRAWGLRLWPWEGKDLLHGLVRVEVAPANESTERANEISRWILAERAPVSAPDRRWDRLLYGIYSVEQYLKARRG